MNNFFEENILLKLATEEVINLYKVHNNLTKLKNNLNDLQLFKALDQYEKSLDNQGKYLRGFMHLVEIILSRLVGTTLILIKHVHEILLSYNQINYARLTPEYVSDMFTLQQDDIHLPGSIFFCFRYRTCIRARK